MSDTMLSVDERGADFEWAGVSFIKNLVLITQFNHPYF